MNEPNEQLITLEQCKHKEGHIRAKLQQATLYLSQQGVAEAQENAELILLYVLQIERSQLLLMWFDSFPSDKLEQWAQLLLRKGKGEPIQYMIGEAWFYGRKFKVSPAVLIPRPETELLVEAVLQEGRALWSVEQEEQPTVLDVGTGSGAISITLQLEAPSWTVIASDISQEALKVAKANASELHAVASMQWVEGDLLQPFLTSSTSLALAGKAIDILVSNPPYIPISDMEGLQREVRDYEPHLALVGGADGLDPYRVMIEQLAQLVQKPRIVAFELGIHQPAIVARMLQEMNAWDEVRVITDYNGIDRHVIAIRK